MKQIKDRILLIFRLKFWLKKPRGQIKLFFFLKLISSNREFRTHEVNNNNEMEKGVYGKERKKFFLLFSDLFEKLPEQCSFVFFCLVKRTENYMN